MIVWWAGQQEADDVVSPCWPQDLYKVGEYDSEEGELWADDEADEEEERAEGDEGSDASWTTESEAEVELDDSAVFHTDEEDKKGIRRSARKMTLLFRRKTLQTSKVYKALCRVEQKP